MARLRGGRPTPVTVLGGTVRLLAGATLAWWVWMAAASPAIPRVAALAAAATAAATLWRPAAGLLIVAALAPAGALLAPPPARAAELLAWTWLTVWLLAIWRPLSSRARLDSPSPVVLPALLYAGALAASWVALTLAAAPGVPVIGVPRFLFQSIAPDHLILSSPEPETWVVLQSLTGIALLVASIAIARRDDWLRRRIVPVLVASAALLGVLTVVAVIREWGVRGYEASFLLRYVQGERFSAHLRDLNAAGSLYVLAGLAAAGAAIDDTRRRAFWLAALGLMVPALWLTGSRTSFLAAIGGVLFLALAQRRWPLTRRQVTAAVAAASAGLIVAMATMDWQPDVRGSAAGAVNLRSQFLETTGRMFASAPLFGVGVGRYFDRSAEFMPATLRAIYGNENAHNYFAQQFAELGVVGGLLFAWLVWAVVAAGWSAVRAPAEEHDSARLAGLFAGVGAYLLTCLTGHPLLVPEAAIPFWIACGALAAAHPHVAPREMPRTAVTLAVCAVLAAGVTRSFLAYARVADPPPDQGFHGLETAPDGTMFRWMTRHAVAYVPSGAGFVRLEMHAPEDVSMERPLVIETALGGEVVDRRELAPGRWVTFDVPARTPSAAPFRRIDLRTNQVWTQQTRLGRRDVTRPIAAMVGEIRWIPLEEVGGR